MMMARKSSIPLVILSIGARLGSVLTSYGSEPSSTSIQEWRAETFSGPYSSAPDIIRDVTVRSIFECITTSAIYARGTLSCQLVEFHTPTRQCRLMKCNRASNEAAGEGWSVYKVQDNRRPIEIVVDNPGMPYQTVIPRCLDPGSVITIIGIPPANPKQMAVLLTRGSKSDQSLHLDIRYNYGNEYNVIVLTSTENGKWAPEQRPNTFPFVPGVKFELVIQVTKDCFKINVDGQLLAVFTYRYLPTEAISNIDILRDMNLLQVVYDFP